MRVMVSPSHVTVDYVFSDPGQSDNGQVKYSYNILPNAGDNAPVANNQAVNTQENTGVVVNLGASDVDGDALSYQVVTSPAHGSLSGTMPNLVYTPNPGYLGLDSFNFKANEGTKDSNVATVNVNVAPKPASSLLLTILPNQSSYVKGQSVALTVNVFNQLNSALDSTLTLTITGPEKYEYFDFQTVSVAAVSVGEYRFNWIIPNVAGSYVMETDLIPPQLAAYDSQWVKVI